nr:MAG TPA: hypothetical protein [Caudoviricetes sp.]
MVYGWHEAIIDEAHSGWLFIIHGYLLGVIDN